MAAINDYLLESCSVIRIFDRLRRHGDGRTAETDDSQHSDHVFPEHKKTPLLKNNNYHRGYNNKYNFKL